MEKKDTKMKTPVIGYEGTIKVTLKKGNKVCSSKTYKNNGRWPLFEFIAYCLAGDYKLCEALRPIYINLFSADDKLQPIPVIDDEQSDHSLTPYTTAQKRLSLSTYPYDTVSKIQAKDENPDGIYNIGSSSITYNFIIPFTHIDTTAQRPINLVCLYNKENISVFDEPSAYFFVPDPDNNKVLGNLVDDEIFEMNSNEYNLFIDWTLNINNGNVKKE